MRIRFEDGCEVWSEQPIGQRRGYYLVRQSDGHRFFISKEVNPCALEHVCKQVLSDKNGYVYWIDKSLGLDVDGKPAWANIDHTDAFI